VTVAGGGTVVRESLRAVRTFRLMPDGALAPITRTEPWTDGTNSASCHRRRSAQVFAAWADASTEPRAASSRATNGRCCEQAA